MSQTSDEAAVAAHYGMLLGIQSPWQVKRAKLEVAQRLVDIEVEHDSRQPVRCPQCRREGPRHVHAPERTWRHLDVMQFTTQIRARLPRCTCPEHKVVTVTPPWAEPGSRFTLMFEAFAVQVLRACASLTQAVELLRLDWDSVQRIMDRAVQRGLTRRSTEAVTQVGLDEKSFGRGQDYVSLMTDLQGRRVLEVVADRTTEVALALWKSLPEEQRKQVQAASMDMGANFAAATAQAAPAAKIVHDHFHVSKQLNDAVNKVRREEHRRLLAVLETDAGTFSVPSKVLSYLCAGRPLLTAMPATNLAARLVTSIPAGISVSPDEPARFVSYARQLRSDAKNRLAFATAARRYAETNFQIAE